MTGGDRKMPIGYQKNNSKSHRATCTSFGQLRVVLLILICGSLIVLVMIGTSAPFKFLESPPLITRIKVSQKPDIHPAVVFLEGEEESWTSDHHQLKMDHQAEEPVSFNVDTTQNSETEDLTSSSCVYQKWQNEYHPTCSDIHALSLSDLEVAWSVELLRVGGRRVLYTVGGTTQWLYKLERLSRFIDIDLKQSLESARREVAVMGQLGTTSTVGVFGLCGTSSWVQQADSPETFGEYLIRNPPTMLQKLDYALNISKAVASIHSLSVIWRDMDLNNLIMVQGQVKLIDFHVSLHIPYNNTARAPCFPHSLKRYKTLDRQAPEEIAETVLTQKMDIYRFGGILFSILTEGARLYDCNTPPGECAYFKYGKVPQVHTVSDQEIITLKNTGVLPTLPVKIMASTNRAILAIRHAMERALRPIPEDRPSAQELVEELGRARELLARAENGAALAPAENTSVETENTTTCLVLPGERLPVIEPVYVAAYPGSGSELTLNIVQSMTGIQVKSHGGQCEPPPTPYDYIAIKTHYPWHCKKEWTHGLLSRAVVLIRNPIDALPSKSNRQYEHDKKGIPHSRQAPKQYWIGWRDKLFAQQIRLWEELVHYWYKRYARGNLFALPYEHLVGTTTGPRLIRQLTDFFAASLYSNATSATSGYLVSECFWQKVVAGDKSGRRSGIHRSKEYKPMFTETQFDTLLEVMSRLNHQYRDTIYGSLFAEYGEAVEERKSLWGDQEKTFEQPQIAWWMSYPNSYNTKIRQILQVTTNTSVATNYGKERINLAGAHTFDATVSVPVHEGETDGPFRVTENLPLPTHGYILTKTHCGINGCLDCNVLPPDEFLRECLSGSKVMKNGRSHAVQYSLAKVKRAVHLVLNPLSNLVTRFPKGDRDGYQGTREGFYKWCQDYDELYVFNSQRSELIPLDVLASPVLCHSALFKYIQFHNRALEVVRRANLPVHFLFAEDLAKNATFEATLGSLLEFCELDRVDTGQPFNIPDPTTYLSESAVNDIVKFLKRYASDELWNVLVKKYFQSTIW